MSNSGDEICINRYIVIVFMKMNISQHTTVLSAQPNLVLSN